MGKNSNEKVNNNKTSKRKSQNDKTPNKTPKKKKTENTSKEAVATTSKQTECKATKGIINDIDLPNEEELDYDLSKNNNSSILPRNLTDNRLHLKDSIGRISQRLKNKQHGLKLPDNFKEALKSYIENGSEFENREARINNLKPVDNADLDSIEISKEQTETVTTPVNLQVTDNITAGFVDQSDEQNDQDTRRVTVTDDQGLQMQVETGNDDFEQDGTSSEDEDGGSSDDKLDSDNDDEPAERRLPIRRNLFDHNKQEPKVKSKVVKPNTALNNKKEETIAEFERLKQLPDVQKFLQLMGSDNNKDGKKRGKLTMDESKHKHKPFDQTPVSKRKQAPVVKSPSDTTMYSPALKQRRFPQALEKFQTYEHDDPELDDRISNCIDEIRLHDFPDDRASRENSQETRESRGDQPGTSGTQPKQDSARDRANEIILEAERRKAAVVAPTGNGYKNESNGLLSLLLSSLMSNNDQSKTSNQQCTVPLVDLSFSDDRASFNNSTCHLDLAIKQKIGAGSFLEINKLVNRNKLFKENDNMTMEKISHDGKTYFIPATGGNSSNNRDVFKITNFARWEEAFRIYAQIYSQYNPHHAAEIYQYIHTIHTASLSYRWENVAYYDYIFRQNMSENPQRSWGKIFTELWTLSMKEPLALNNIIGQNYSDHNKRRGSSGDLREICCWRYNCNQCRKSAKDCKYEHRCSYCGLSNHIYLNCHRRQKQNGNNGGNSNNNNSLPLNNDREKCWSGSRRGSSGSGSGSNSSGNNRSNETSSN